MSYFAVTTVHGPEWDDAQPIREQEAWDAHAAFMDGLVDRGSILLGGPLDDGQRALLIFQASDEAEVRRLMAPDPWAAMKLLHVGSVHRWLIWLDGRSNPAR
jgi:uncharacterized protein YciI